MVLSMTSKSSSAPQDLLGRNNFSIDSLLGKANLSGKSESISAKKDIKLTIPSSLSIQTSQSAETNPATSTLNQNCSIFYNLPFMSPFFGVQQTNLMEPIYRTDSSSQQNTSQSTVQQPAIPSPGYPWSAWAALHTNSMRAAAAAALSSSYLPGILPVNSLENQLSEWGMLIQLFNLMS